MTYQPDYAPDQALPAVPAELLEMVAEQGLDALQEMIRIIINTASRPSGSSSAVAPSDSATPSFVRAKCRPGIYRR